MTTRVFQLGAAAVGVAAVSLFFVSFGWDGSGDRGPEEGPDSAPPSMAESAEPAEPVAPEPVAPERAAPESPNDDSSSGEQERSAENAQRESMPEPVVADRAPGQQPPNAPKRKQYDPAVLKVVTNFNLADVTVNGLPYPEYEGNGENEGMVLPAGGPYTVKVNYNDKTKTYRIYLEPYRTRMLMVELSGFKGKSLSKSDSSKEGGDKRTRRHKKKDKKDGEGRLTVYGKPKGQIYVDGNAKDQTTPGTITVEAGQHDVQVRFEDGEMSESKTVRVREGAQIKLFFRRED